jgi:hypothetical protein
LNFLVYEKFKSNFTMSASSSSKITKRGTETSGSLDNAAKRLHVSGKLALGGESVDESEVHSDAEDIGSTEQDWAEEPDYNPIEGEEMVGEQSFKAITLILSRRYALFSECYLCNSDDIFVGQDEEARQESRRTVWRKERHDFSHSSHGVQAMREVRQEDSLYRTTPEGNFPQTLDIYRGGN